MRFLSLLLLAFSSLLQQVAALEGGSLRRAVHTESPGFVFASDIGTASHKALQNKIRQTVVDASGNVKEIALTNRSSSEIRNDIHGEIIAETHGIGISWMPELRPRLYLPGVRVAPTNFTIYCYVFARSPFEAAKPYVEARLSAACDAWNVFSARGDNRKTFVAYDMGEFNKYHESAASARAWEQILKIYGNPPPFDWFVKLDMDSFLRPASFRRMFAAFDHRTRVILSIGDFGVTSRQHVFFNSRGRCGQVGPEVDGFFAALSRGALLTLLHDGLVENLRNGRCAQMVTGADNGDDTKLCLRRYKIAVVGPCNAEGFAVVMPHPPTAVIEEMGFVKGLQQFVTRTPGSCFPEETFDTPQGRGCFSHDVAVIHGIKDVSIYAELSQRL